MKKWSGLFGAAAVAGLALTVGAVEKIDDPYGVCAHVSRGELEVAPQEFNRMKEAQINWVRTDFDWNGVEPKQGQWNFSHLDQLMKLAKQEQMNILPILDYDVPWATPAWKNLGAWEDYVTRIVSRYQNDMKYWEVWNEQNGDGFWRDTPSGTNYVPLLKRSYETIKKINPDLVVLYGGTAGVPLGYIEDSFKAGAGNYFDVMNIHPYHWQGTPELMLAEFRDLKALMKKYNLEKKPIWITEVGWSTALAPRFYREVLPAAFKRIGLDPSQLTVALVNDQKLGFSGAGNFDVKQNLAAFKSTEYITLKELKNISVKKYPVLIPTVGEEFPAQYLPELKSYVKRGGTLILPSGLPFYYDLQLDGKGGATKVQVNDKYLADFHMGWDAWWTADGVPKAETYQKPAPGFEKEFQINFKPTNRFLHNRNLKPGDEFIPVIEAGTDNYRAAVMGIYKLNSDLKGNIIVCTTMTASETVPEARQAEMLPRTYLLAMANGVERIFWYNFRSGEWDPEEREAHFGIVRRDQLVPKPSFVAYQTLSRLCPTGSTQPELKVIGNLVYVCNWIRPDGVKVWAIWTAQHPQPVKLTIQGKVTEALNHLGEKQAVPGTSYEATPSILYLVGPTSVSVR